MSHEGTEDARFAGILFLISLVTGFFGEAYVPSTIIISVDAAGTVSNIRNQDLLYQLGFAGFLVESLCDVALAAILYVYSPPRINADRRRGTDFSL